MIKPLSLVVLFVCDPLSLLLPRACFRGDRTQRAPSSERTREPAPLRPPRASSLRFCRELPSCSLCYCPLPPSPRLLLLLLYHHRLLLRRRRRFSTRRSLATAKSMRDESSTVTRIHDGPTIHSRVLPYSLIERNLRTMRNGT